MHNILKDIISHKNNEVAQLKKTKHFKKALQTNGLSFIGEIKRKSPSKGHLAQIPDPVQLYDLYEKAGIEAISILTDHKYFGGSIDDLKSVCHRRLPILRKDFIIDKIQIAESLIAGADAILLIVAVLKHQTVDFLAYARQLGMDVIVEVHNKAELDVAIDIGAEIIGINNRSLETFDENIDVCIDLVKFIPGYIVKVAESAICTSQDIARIKAAGFDAVLIGEAFVKDDNPTDLILAMREVV